MDENNRNFILAIVLSMTPSERRRPEIINGSRRKRIARGSGTNVSQVNKLLKQYRDMKRMIARELHKKGMDANIKLGMGGIREIEFIVQSMQLLRGGARPALARQELLQVLPQLADDRASLDAPQASELGREGAVLRRDLLGRGRTGLPGHAFLHGLLHVVLHHSRHHDGGHDFGDRFVRRTTDLPATPRVEGFQGGLPCVVGHDPVCLALLLGR